MRRLLATPLAAGLRQVTKHWTGNLRAGLGETGTDAVLLRSFSALDLSIVAALDLETPFLRSPEVAALAGMP
jgi:hypothetical protein